MSEIILVGKDIVKTYQSASEQITVLQGVNIEIPEGISVAISGESGSGKSTLLNILGGLDRCDHGEVTVGPYQLSSLSEKELNEYRNRHVGFVFQFHYLLKDFNAIENVMLPAYMAGVPRKVAMNNARVLLHEVGMDNRIHHYPSQLSGGERQRVAVARSLINKPEIVVADEPTGNLDPRNSELVVELLFSCVEKLGGTLVMVTHDEKIARRATFHYRLEGGVLHQISPEKLE
jgi:lipoprotein-releasing system ATP-binding protein